MRSNLWVQSSELHIDIAEPEVKVRRRRRYALRSSITPLIHLKVGMEWKQVEYISPMHEIDMPGLQRRNGVR